MLDLSRRNLLLGAGVAVAVGTMGISSTAAAELSDPRKEPNGNLDPSLLVYLSWVHKQIWKGAAPSFELLNKAFLVKFGTTIAVTDGYRTLAEQYALKAGPKGHLAGTPGTSNHGWGVAVDLGSGINVSFNSEEHKWMRANAPSYGWDLPLWARIDGSKPEPWHWEYMGSGSVAEPEAEPEFIEGDDMLVVHYGGTHYSVTALSVKPCSREYATVWSTVTGRPLVDVNATSFNAILNQVNTHIVDTAANLKGQGL